MLDCLVIGGGPAGLTAAIYLARFHLDVLVVDDGKSRAKWIPVTNNHAGFPEGISGKRLLERMEDQARRYKAEIVRSRVGRLDVHRDGGFVADWGSGSVRARSVLLATGVTNRRPAMDNALHDEAMARGLIRYCPICDGYEVTDKRVGVIGTDDHGVREAIFLRGFTADVTLIAPAGPHALNDAQSAQLQALGITIADGPTREVEIAGDRIAVSNPDGRMSFESVYPALGSDVHSQLASIIGAATAEGGCIIVDDHQRASLPGLYAAGDVVIGLDQISHAMGEGGMAATTIRNDLAKNRPLVRRQLLSSELTPLVEDARRSNELEDPAASGQAAPASDRMRPPRHTRPSSDSPAVQAGCGR